MDGTIYVGMCDMSLWQGDSSFFPTLTHLLDHSGMVFNDGPVLTNLLHPGRDVQLSMGNVLK